MKGEGREGCSCFVWSNGDDFIYLKISPGTFPVSVKHREIPSRQWNASAKHPQGCFCRGCTSFKAGSCGIGGPLFFIDEWWVMSEVSVSSNGIATALCWIPIRVGVTRFWTLWSCYQVLCFVWFEQGWTFLQITKHIPPQKITTNNKYEFCSLSTLNLCSSNKLPNSPRYPRRPFDITSTSTGYCTSSHPFRMVLCTSMHAMFTCLGSVQFFFQGCFAWLGHLKLI